MRFLITGSHGLIGSALTAHLTNQGHEVVPLLRQAPTWNPEEGQIDKNKLESFDSVIHLAGESITQSRWTSSVKKRLRESRIQGTQLLASALASLSHPPKHFLCASAVGIYGSRGTEDLTEESQPGTGFLADLVRDWEAAAASPIPTTFLRFGMALSKDGGALAKLMPAFRLGAGGVLGDGHQYMSWIALDDLILAIDHIILNTLLGPVNCTAPNPVTNSEFTATLARLLDRHPGPHIPTFAARLLFGEMADSVLLASQKALPKQLLASGFTFRYPLLKDALSHQLIIAL